MNSVVRGSRRPVTNGGEERRELWQRVQNKLTVNNGIGKALPCRSSMYPFTTPSPFRYRPTINKTLDQTIQKRAFFSRVPFQPSFSTILSLSYSSPHLTFHRSSTTFAPNSVDYTNTPSAQNETSLMYRLSYILVVVLNQVTILQVTPQ